jgi:predicted cupin superfamily sugar epimerase
MEPHPEGGYYKETYRSSTNVSTPFGPRSASTAIKFLVTKDSVSRLHRIKSDELWHFYEGGSMTVVEMDKSAPGHVKTTTLGPGGEQQ